jgi:hypothetical protein
VPFGSRSGTTLPAHLRNVKIFSFLFLSNRASFKSISHNTTSRPLNGKIRPFRFPCVRASLPSRSGTTTTEEPSPSFLCPSVWASFQADQAQQRRKSQPLHSAFRLLGHLSSGSGATPPVHRKIAKPPMRLDHHHLKGRSSSSTLTLTSVPRFQAIGHQRKPMRRNTTSMLTMAGILKSSLPTNRAPAQEHEAKHHLHADEGRNPQVLASNQPGASTSL